MRFPCAVFCDRELHSAIPGEVLGKEERREKEGRKGCVFKAATDVNNVPLGYFQHSGMETG